MKISILILMTILSIVLIFKKVVNSAKRNLFKDQAAWSGKDIKIKHRTSGEDSKSKENDNYLKIIADESEIYLEDQSLREEDEGK